MSSRCLIFVLCAGVSLAQGRRSGPATQGIGTGSERQSKKGKAAVPPPTPLLVDAVAVAADGTPVRDLTAADFGVTVHGEGRTVTSVRYVNAKTGAISPGLPELALKPDQIHRTVVLVVDDLGLSAAAAETVRNTLARFLQREMDPRDAVAIVRTAADSGTLEKLSTDRSLLAAAVPTIRYNPQPAFDEAGAAGARSILHQVLYGLYDVPGRKAVILFSGNPRLFEKAATTSLIEAANRASAVVSLIDLRAGPVTRDAGPPPLAAFASGTGGQFVSPTSDLPAALTAVLRDQEGYYLLAYKPEESSNDAVMGRPWLQRPIVTTTRVGVAMRARNGLLNTGNFLSNSEERQLWRPTFTTPAADMQRGFNNPFVSGAIPVRFAAVDSAAKLGMTVEGRVHIDAKDLTFVNRLNGETNCSLDIQIAAFDENGIPSQAEGHSYNLEFSRANAEEALTKGFVAAVRLSMRAAGPYQVRVAVRDGTSGRIGSASQFLEVKDVSGADLVIPGIILTPKDNSPDQPAINIFHAGESFNYTYQIVNLTVDENRHSEAEVRTRVIRDGKAIFENTPAAVPFDASDNPKVRTAVAGVRLGGMEPGYYVLEISLQDKLSKKPRTTTQYAEFQVIPMD